MVGRDGSTELWRPPVPRVYYLSESDRSIINGQILTENFDIPKLGHLHNLPSFDRNLQRKTCFGTGAQMASIELSIIMVTVVCPTF